MTFLGWWRNHREPKMIVIRTGRSPHEILVCITSILFGALGIALGSWVSPVIDRMFTSPWDTMYFLGLMLSGLVALYGVWRYRLEGLLIERIGLTVMALFFAAYSVAIVVDRGWEGLAGAAIPLCFTMSNVARVIQIRQDLKMLPQALKATGDAS